MARKFATSIDLAKNELQNPRMHQLSAAPSSPVAGQFYYDTDDNIGYYWNGGSWVAMSDASAAAHIADTSAAHAASAVLVDSTNLVGTGTDAQTVFEELDDAIVAAAGGGAHTHDEDDLVPDSVTIEEFLRFSTAVTDTSTGTVNDWAPTGIDTTGTVRWNGASVLTVTGIVVTGVAEGRMLLVSNVTGGVNLVLSHEDTNSTAANRIYLPGAAGTLALKPRSAIWLKYDGTLARWLVVLPNRIGAVAGANITVGATGTVGAATDLFAGSGHGHRLDTYTSNPAAIGTAAPGTSTDAPAAGTHVHPTGAGTPSTQAFGDAAATGSGPAAAMTNHVHGMPAHDDAAHGTVELNDLAAPDGDVAFGGFKITGLGTPTAGTDGATKAYVDAAAAGIDWKASVRAATTAAGTLATSFENGDAVDGVTLATGDRILIKDQAAGAENGIYTVNASGAPTRATDADVAAEVTAGMAVFVEAGTVNADTGWILTNDGAITIGTTALVFAQFTALGQVTAGTGLTKTGSTINAVAGTGIVANADDIAVLRTDANGRVPLRYAADVGDNSATSFNIDHNLNSLDVIVQVYQKSDGVEIVPDVTRSTVNRVVLGFTTAPTSAQHRVVVLG